MPIFRDSVYTRDQITWLDLLQWPIWIVDIHEEKIWWANQVALNLWNLQSLEELDHLSPALISLISELKTLHEKKYLESGKPFLHEWTLCPQEIEVRIQCVSQLILIETGHPALFIEGITNPQQILSQDLIYAWEGVNHTPILLSLYTLEGETLMQNPSALFCYGDEKNSKIASQNGLTNHFIDTTLANIMLKTLKQGLKFHTKTQVKTLQGIQWHQVDGTLIQNPLTNGKIILITEQEITDFKEVESELRHRDQLLEGVTKAKNQLLTTSNYDQAIYQALEVLGKITQVDRVSIFENYLEGDNQFEFNQRWEWCQRGEMVKPQNLSYQTLGVWWHETLSASEIISGDITSLPSCTQEVLKQNQVCCVLVIPIQIEDKFWGFMEFDDCHQVRSWSESDKSILTVAAGSIGGAIARHQAEEKLAARDRLLQGVAQATNHLLTTTDYHGGIYRALEVLGETSHVDRVYVFELHSYEGNLVASQRGIWVAPEINPPQGYPNLYNIPVNTTATWWYNILSTGKIISGLVKYFPSPEREMLEQHGIRSLLVVSIWLDGKFWGFIGFDDCHQERQWSDSEKSILMAVAGSIGGVISRQQAEQKLAQLNVELESRVEERTAKLQSMNQKLILEISERKRVEKQLRHNAYHDILTGLSNRTLLMEHLKEQVIRAQSEPNYLFAVLFLDMDRFKVVNDSIGHTLGDELLIAIAQRLRECVDKKYLITRLGGDEFAIVLKDIQGVQDAICLAEKIHEGLTPPFCLDDQEVFTTVSIGIALSSTGYSHPEEILRDADIVMYHAKALGRSRHEVFRAETHDHLVGLLKLENDLRRAVKVLEDENYWSMEGSLALPFELHYQSIINLMTGRITGFEALIRWRHPELGFISPADFIPIAEETGLIVPLGSWVLKKAVYQLKKWHQQFSDLLPLTMSVNLSGRQFSRSDLLAQIDQLLEELELEGSCLKLEITETILVENNKTALEFLLRLKERSVQLCMDDFGTGYSSLSYLHQFPFDVLKIDRSFVNRIGVDGQENAAIVQTIVTLADYLGMQVIAEGVETEFQLEILQDLGCKLGQGYFFSRPLNASLATELLMKERKKRILEISVSLFS